MKLHKCPIFIILVINAAIKILAKEDGSGIPGYFKCTNTNTNAVPELPTVIGQEDIKTSDSMMGESTITSSDPTSRTSWSTINVENIKGDTTSAMSTEKDVGVTSETTIQEDATTNDKPGSTANSGTTYQGGKTTQTVTITSSTNTGTASLTVPSTQKSIGENCFLPGENVSVLTGSFLVNNDCTVMYNCTDGLISVNEGYSCSLHAVCETREETHRCYCSSGYLGNGEECTIIQMGDCLDVFNAGFITDGIYTIKPTNWNEPPFEVFCNMTDGGGWTVFQRRVDGLVDFDRNWTSYKEGFGKPNHEFWLGNDKLYYLTNQGKYQLRIDLGNSVRDHYFAQFQTFRINDESDNYRLSDLGAFDGTAVQFSEGGIALSYHLNTFFSTSDRNNRESPQDCLQEAYGGWWFKGCGKSNLNGDYRYSFQSTKSINWFDLPGSWYKIMYTEMKIRPAV
ncbi:fibrinogen-like protein 1 isoform X1 [Apostichopus japonicus]|uniref:fibrinogen-like protein 1 isoform X1 n=1 Tax=Stichopus japonicus TaxID=307972 RepID=UPI003AB75A4C